ncbi:MAG: hypothetical protein CEE38_23710, partial [Planctomycetes bacterium B3_Pla]
RWIEILSEYDYKIEHRPGRIHNNADALSRSPCTQCGKTDWRQAKIDAWDFDQPSRALTTRSQTQAETETPRPDETDPQPGTSTEQIGTIPWLQAYTRQDLQELQKVEEWYPTIYGIVAQEIDASDLEYTGFSPATKVLFGMRHQLRIEDGVLYRRWTFSDGKERQQLIAPTKIRKEIFELAHSAPTGGHMGARRMLAKIRRRYYWPCMGMDIRQWILSCDECASRNTSRLKKAKMRKFPVGAPMERIAMDIMGPLPRSTRGNKYILVVGDYFTKWIEAYALPNQEAKTVADVLTREFFSHYGTPMEIHADQGRNFESAIFQEVCKIFDIRKTRTTAFHPQSDGFIERFNRTLQQMLALYTNNSQTDWDQVLPIVMAAYRATPQDTTGQSPNLLMMGREILMPLDLLAGQPPGEEPTETTEYGIELRERLTKVYEEVRRKIGREMSRQKKLYDRGKTGMVYQPGDRVWQRISQRTKGKTPKLQRRWKGPCLIVNRYTDVTYLVANGPRQPPKVVHFDRLKLYTGEKYPDWMNYYQNLMNDNNDDSAAETEPSSDSE